MTPQVHAHVNAAWKLAAASLEENGGIETLAVLAQRDSGKVFFMPASSIPSKDAFALLLPVAVKQTNADIVIMMTEAWMAEVTKEEFRSGKAILPPSENPQRVEVVMVSWKTNDGEEGAQIHRLVRDETNKPSIGESMPSMVEGNGQGYNKFFDAIFMSQTIH
jgi:hypothetical protein